MGASAVSIQGSKGGRRPRTLGNLRRPGRRMRPLIVRTERGSSPLFCNRWPVWGCFGGGGSRLLGLEAELDSGLVGDSAEARQEVADFLLAGVDDLAGWGLVDG